MAGIIGALRSSGPALPYIARLIVFRPVDLTFRLTIAPGQSYGVADGVDITAAELQLVTTLPYISPKLAKPIFGHQPLSPFADCYPKAGVMTDEEANAWAEGLQNDSANGVFFGASYHLPK